MNRDMKRKEGLRWLVINLIYISSLRKVLLIVRNIARIANAVQVPICLLVSTSVY